MEWVVAASLTLSLALAGAVVWLTVRQQRQARVLKRLYGIIRQREMEKAKESLLQMVLRHPFYRQFCTPGRYLVSGPTVNEYLGRRAFDSESLNPIQALVEIGRVAVERGDLQDKDSVYQALRRAIDRSQKL